MFAVPAPLRVRARDRVPANFGCYKGAPSKSISAHGAPTAIAPAPFRSSVTVHFDPPTVRPRSPRTDILRSPCIVEADRFTSPQLQGRGLARRAPTPLAAAAFVPCDRGSARSSYMRRRGSAVSHRVVDLVRRHHTVVLVGPGSCALCSYTCVQILIGHHDAWSPLGRQTWARPRVHAARESPCMFCMLSCFACVLF